ncbi:MAG: gas vesicle protein GvpD P-loop domain-containing protein [Candidatus Thermoplasmatota archaeon]
MKMIKSIPPEIKEFLEKEGGSSVFFEGSSGTGKTTIALQIIEELADPEKSFYLSTRVSDEALYTQFPWLEDKEMRSQITDASKVFLETLYGEEEEEKEQVIDEEKKKIKGAKEFLDTIREEGPPENVDRTRLNQLDKSIPGLERIYDRIDNVLPERSLLVIDSIEGITHKYDIDMETFVMTIQKDLVENSNTNLIMVLEKEEAPDLEYLGDGVVQMNRYQLEGRDVRTIKLKKLRAIRIKQPSYLMSLEGGRFKCFEPYELDISGGHEWKPVKAPEGKYSTGTEDIDSLLDGGFDAGSYNIFEVKENVSNEEFFSVIRPIFLNFLSQNRGIITVLSGGTHPENLKDDLTRFISENVFNEKFRIVDYFSSRTNKPYKMALAGKNQSQYREIYNETMKELRGDEDQGILDYTGLDTMEYMQGGEVAVKQLLSGVANTKNSDDLGLGIVKPGLNLSQEIKNMADNYFVILSINKTPCLYGVKPKTGLYAIVTDEEKGLPYIRLDPIV